MSESMDAFAIANDIDFQKRVLLLLSDVCTDVLAEVNTTPNHDARAAHAVLTLSNLRKEAERASFVLVGDNLSAVAGVTSQADFTDTQIKNALTNSFNSLASIFTPSV